MSQTSQPGKQRFLIATMGRSGSSLLSAILATAGADFGLGTTPTEWKRKRGEYESQGLALPYIAYRLYELLPSWPSLLRYTKKFLRNRMKKSLSTTLQKATYLKSPILVYLTQDIYGLGYSPKLIISYRAFHKLAQSIYLNSRRSYSAIVEAYVDIYGTALLQLDMFGGCVVKYADIVDVDNTDWINPVSAITGIEDEIIIECRRKIVQSSKVLTQPFFDTAIDNRVISISETLDGLRGKLIRGSLR